MMSLREQRLKHLNDTVNMASTGEQEYYEAMYLQLSEIKATFPNFRLKFTAKRKVVKGFCDGDCYDNPLAPKYKLNELLKFEGHSKHSYCQNCFNSWVTQSLTKNPKLPIICQRCSIVGTEQFVITDDILYHFGFIAPEYLQYLRENFIDETLYAKCCNQACQTIVQKDSAMGFLCNHYYCDMHREQLVANTLDQWYYYFTDINNPVQGLFFELSCECGSEVSRNSQWKNCIFQWLQNAQHLQSPQVYIDFVSQYTNFIHYNVPLVRCTMRSCGRVYEYYEGIICQSCKICLSCNNIIHSGLSCTQFGTLQNQNIYNFDAPIKPPLPTDHRSVEIYAKIGTKIEGTLNTPKRITNVWTVSNEYLDFMFTYGRDKKFILSDGMPEDAAKNILKTGFPIDISFDRIVFPVKINFRPENLYFFYCEVMYDKSVQEDPKLAAAGPNEIVLAEFANKYLLSSATAVRIQFMFSLDPAA